MNPVIEFEKLVEDENFLQPLGRGVWLMDDHRWALKVWETERTHGQYTLVHADYHWVWPPERTYSKLAGLKVLMNLERRAGGEDVPPMGELTGLLQTST